MLSLYDFGNFHRSDYSAIMHRMHGARTGRFRFSIAISVHTARSERTLLLLSSDMDVQYFQRSAVVATSSMSHWPFSLIP